MYNAWIDGFNLTTIEMMNFRSLILAPVLLVACGRISRTSDTDDGAASDDARANDDGAASDGAGGTDNGAVSGGAGGGGNSSQECMLVRSGVEEIQLKTQADVEALRGVHTIKASLYVTGSVTDLSPLACLSHIEGDLGVYETEALRDFTGLEQLQTIEGSLYLGGFCNRPHVSSCHGNVALSQISALTNLQAVSSIHIQPKCDGEGGGCVAGSPIEEIRFDALTQLDELVVRGLPSLVEVRLDALESAMAIDLSGDKLESLHFAKLRDVARLSLVGVPKLESLSSFSRVSQIKYLSLGSTTLTDLAGLEVTRLDALRLTSNDELMTLAGLENLQEVGTLSVFGNERLESLEGLNSVKTIDEVEITLNPSLTSLDGFEGLTHAGKIFVQSNYALTDIRGLHSLEVVDDSLIFWTNTLLPHCEADRLRDLIGEENIGSYAVSGGDEEAVCDP